MIRSTALACLCLLPAVGPLRSALRLTQEGVQPVEEARLGDTSHVHRSGELWFAGQFPEQDIDTIRESGIRRVISLRLEGEIPWDEKALVESAGLEFVSIPLRAPETFTDEALGRLRGLLNEEGVPTLLHCASANRVGGAWLPFRVLDQGVPVDQALAEAKTIGLGHSGYEQRVLEYIDQQVELIAARKPSVKPGINDPFKDPELDVQEFIGRFEVESREIYSARHAVVEALGIRPGMHVADIGAGTGLYTFLLTEAVGASGWVYAVDIAPRFLQHILGLASEKQTVNLTGVLCPEDSIGLPAASIDLAYVCDTYHHFEYPDSTLASLRRALRPGARLIVIDFERIPGVTREWLLEHVRAGKPEFRAEIERAGFEFLREIEVAGLEENYVLEFRKAPV
jgi:uncharacterized protein (TIGR01244 family)